MFIPIPQAQDHKSPPATPPEATSATSAAMSPAESPSHMEDIPQPHREQLSNQPMELAISLPLTEPAIHQTLAWLEQPLDQAISSQDLLPLPHMDHQITYQIAGNILQEQPQPPMEPVETLHPPLTELLDQPHTEAVEQLLTEPLDLPLTEPVVQLELLEQLELLDTVVQELVL